MGKKYVPPKIKTLSRLIINDTPPQIICSWLKGSVEETRRYLVPSQKEMNEARLVRSAAEVGAGGMLIIGQNTYAVTVETLSN